MFCCKIKTTNNNNNEISSLQKKRKMRLFACVCIQYNQTHFSPTIVRACVYASFSQYEEQTFVRSERANEEKKVK